MTTPDLDPTPDLAALARLWAFARANQQIAAAVATRPGADDQLRWSQAAGHLGEAADELQRARPAVAAHPQFPQPVAGLDQTSNEEATTQVATGIVAALGDFDYNLPGLSPADLLAAGNAAYWLGMAHHALTGNLP